MIVTIDGPEKAGKTTLCNLLCWETGAKYRHWGPVSSDVEFLGMLQHDATSDDWYIWDRCWASEHVYASLLNRNRRLANDPWLGEWLYGRAVRTRGVQIMLIPTVDTTSKRDNTDLPVNPGEEARAFTAYGHSTGWCMLTNDYTSDSLERNGRAVCQLMRDAKTTLMCPGYCGPREPKVVVVGEKRSQGKLRVPGTWLPFTSKLTMQLGRVLGYKAFDYGWTSIKNVPVEFLQDKTVIACGGVSATWLRKEGVKSLIYMPNPAWVYRFNNMRTDAAKSEIQRIMSNLGE